MQDSKKRYGILSMVFVSVVVNYLDRSNLSVAAAALSSDLGFTTVQMGLIFSAFGWTYASLQIPGGILVDKIKARVLYPILLVLWSVATLLQGLVSSLQVLIGLRASIGVFEAPSFPMNNAIVTRWFPENERASAIAVYTSGQYMGLAFLTPILVFVQDQLGWRGLFISSGLVGIAYAIIWYLFYRDPKHTEPSDLSDVSEEKVESKFQWQDLSFAFSHRKLWGIYIGQFCLGSTFIFFLTWFPTYLVEQRGIEFAKSGILASIPFLGAFIGVLISGFISDWMSKKGISKEVARKAPVLSGLLLSSVIVLANYTESTALTIAYLTIAFFGTGFASIAWVFVSLISPKEKVGLIGGVFNLMGGLSAVIIPFLVGLLAQGGNFEPALALIGGIAMVGFLSYTFLVGKVERIKLKDDLV